jgi:hypothetical protein
MDRLVEIYQALPPALPEVRAAWLHHRFTQIHPFQDGNGRVARALASFELIRAGLLPLLVEREDRDTHYIPALEAADTGDLKPLVSFLADSMSRVLMRASAEAEAIVAGKRDFQAVLQAGRKKVEARRGQSSRSTADEGKRLQAAADAVRRNLERVQAEVTEAFPGLATAVKLPGNDWDRDHHYLPPIIKVAQRHGYGVSLAAPRTWVQLVLPTRGGRVTLLTSLHGLSGPNAGTWALDVCVGHESDEGGSTELMFLDIDPLMLTLDEAEPDQLARIDRWIETMKVQAAAQWIQFL